jgi:ribose/xylose/arabinose/galactoside ABC-type transport system permease subunit
MALWGSFGLPLVIVLMMAAFGLLSPNFFTVGNLTNIGRQVSVLALLSWGQTLVIISAGIDLSVSAVIALVSVVAGLTFTSLGPGTGLLAAQATGAGVGLANGLLAAFTRISPFIITLGSLSIVSGLALTISGGVPIWDFPESSLYEIGNGYWLGIPIPIYVALIAFGIVWLLLNRTAFGLHVFAVGGNEQAAIRAGVHVARTKIAIYTISGFLAGLGGLILTLRVQSGQPLLGTELNLQSIAAVVLGGTSLFGGRGRLSGTLYGVIFIGVLANGLDIAGISTFIQEIVVGATLLIAVFFTTRQNAEGR